MHIQQLYPDLTTSNILLSASDRVLAWSDTEVYAYLGEPETETITTSDGQPAGSHTPAELVAPVKLDTPLLEENIVISDFGQSYIAAATPPSYEPATLLNYISPDARFENRAGFEADIWSLACAMFEIRAGFPLFESFLGSDADILRQTVELLGRLPDPWWDTFEERSRWFGEDGRAKPEDEKKRAGVGLVAESTSIRELLLNVGRNVDPPHSYEGRMLETYDTSMPGQEVDLLGDLLRKMLKYKPEDRICLREVLSHPWFV